MTDQTNDNLDLTDEERAALADDSPTDALPAEVVQVPDDAPAAPPAPTADAPPAEAPAATEAPEATKAPERDTFVPQFEVPSVEGLDAKLTELEGKLEAGDLTLVEYNRERDSIQAVKLQADFAARNNEALKMQLWQHEVNRFLRRNPLFRDNGMVNAAFDRAVKDLANDPANNDQEMEWFLETAASQVNAVMGPRPSPTLTAPAPGAKPAIPAPGPRVLNTLAQVPPAAATTNDGEFAALDALVAAGGEEAEAAVAKLTPAQKEKWLKLA